VLRGDGTDLVDATEPRDQPPARDAPRDRAAANPRIEELCGGDEPMLEGRERQDRPIPGVHFCTIDAAHPGMLQLRTPTVRFCITGAIER
jgi:hypothetical protein